MNLETCIFQLVGKADQWWPVNPKTLRRVAKPERYRKVFICATCPRGYYKSCMLVEQHKPGHWKILSRGLFDQDRRYRTEMDMLRDFKDICDESQRLLFEENMFALV